MLSKNAQKAIDTYFNLPFQGVDNVRCPYFIASKSTARGQLRALAGKGTPQEIVEEAKIISIQYGDEVFDKHGMCHIEEGKKNEHLRKYLIDHNLGIDCSGFVVHILQNHYKETKNFNFVSDLQIVSPKKILRYLISKLRPIENIGVRVLANKSNSEKIELGDLKTADMIIMLDTGPNNKRDHILLVTDVINDTIHYVQARAWSSEGKYGHGVSRGSIKIINPKKNLLDQEWVELEKIGENNETYLEAKKAKTLEIRRIKI